MYGTWRNTDPHSVGVVSLAFEGDRVQAWARPGRSESAIDLGQGDVEWYEGREDSTPLAFTARLPSSSADVLLQGNINRGLMILAAYRFDGHAESLAGRFSREFFARREATFVAPEAVTTGTLFGSIQASTTPVLEEFIGRWINADPSSWLPALAIESEPAGLRVTVEGAGPRLPSTWPSITAQAFAYYDELGRDTLLLLGDFQHAAGRSSLQIKVVLGTAVVAAFHRHHDGRRWFQRYFFRRPR